jgi:CspA family cold shock protein
MNGSRICSGEPHLYLQPIREHGRMAEGTIKKLTDKGFGFISTGGSKDLFFHSKALQGVAFDDLSEGQNVTFTEGQGPKGPCAEDVRVA